MELDWWNGGEMSAVQRWKNKNKIKVMRKRGVIVTKKERKKGRLFPFAQQQHGDRGYWNIKRRCLLSIALSYRISNALSVWASNIKRHKGLTAFEKKFLEQNPDARV